MQGTPLAVAGCNWGARDRRASLMSGENCQGNKHLFFSSSRLTVVKVMEVFLIKNRYY